MIAGAGKTAHITDHRQMEYTHIEHAPNIYRFGRFMASRIDAVALSCVHERNRKGRDLFPLRLAIRAGPRLRGRMRPPTDQSIPTESPSSELECCIHTVLKEAGDSLHRAIAKHRVLFLNPIRLSAKLSFDLAKLHGVRGCDEL
jgi:hypothetical protein